MPAAEDLPSSAFFAGLDSVPDDPESEPDDFHGRVRQHFLDLAAREPQRYLVVAADRSRDDIQAAVRERMQALLEHGS